MQKIFTLFSAVFFLTLVAFKPIAGLDDVINSLRGGNAPELSRYIDENVEISLPGKSNTYSKAQALIILHDFFGNNGVRSFEVKHKGDNAGNQFCVGTLVTKSGNYRTSIFMKSKNGRQLVKDISFQPI